MGRYRRTVSFPNPSPNFRAEAAAKSYHVRSASLPCWRSNALIPQLRDEITELRAWEDSTRSDASGPGRVADGLARLKGVLDSLDDVLQLPQTQDTLSSSTPLVEKLLEDFLRFVDVYGIFQASLLGLKQELSGAQVAVRRKDVAKLGLHVKAQKKIAGEISKLVSAVGSVATTAADNRPTTATDHRMEVEAGEELRFVIRDVHRLTASVSAGLFGWASGSFGPGRRPAWAGLTRMMTLKREHNDQEDNNVESMIMKLRKCNNNNSKENNKDEESMRKEVLKRMQEMEDCVGEMEKGSERVFRSLISTRVSLLNILTHA